jgi:hypothetical protein
MGEWRRLEKGHLNLREFYCDTCGQWLPRLTWHEVVAGHSMRFCSPQCVALMETYVIPRHGLPARFR